MIAEAVRDLGIDPGSSWMVGDKGIDIECGRSAGCRTILVQTGYGTLHAGSLPDYIVPDIGEAAKVILRDSTIIPCHAQP
jgi:D-glycero-D-manno-heptose 1,7-bisphosphate phosphatase